MPTCQFTKEICVTGMTQMKTGTMSSSLNASEFRILFKILANKNPEEGIKLTNDPSHPLTHVHYTTSPLAPEISWPYHRLGSTRETWVFSPSIGRCFLVIARWVFPKIGVPPNHPFYRDFHYKPPILGYPYFWKHPGHEVLSYSVSFCCLVNMCCVSLFIFVI